MRSITRADADKWRSKLIADGLKPASVKHHLGNGRGLFREAVESELVITNPMRHFKAGTTPAVNDRYITPEETTRILNHYKDIRLKAQFGLCRLAGLRIGECDELNFDDINWCRGTLKVRSPKTERHPGHESRLVPICPQLMTILRQIYDASADTHGKLLLLRGGNLRRKLIEGIKAAGVQTWDRLFQASRSSCEKQWNSEGVPYVEKLMGHSAAVADKHCNNGVLPDDVYLKVTKKAL